MNKKLYVGNLNFKATEDDLRELFGAYGEVAQVTLVRDNATGRARGFGFVEMNTPEDAQKALDALKGQPFQERNLMIDWARPMENKREGGFRSDRGGDFGNRKSFRRY